MKEINDCLAQYSASIDIEFDGLLSKTARINNFSGTKPEDILGWDYVVHAVGNTCYYLYCAQPPLVGITYPTIIICPLGLRPFDTYQIDFKKAIELLNTVNCGDHFVAMSLYQPLTPQVKEPEWHIRTSLGCEVVIGADSGHILTDKPTDNN